MRVIAIFCITLMTLLHPASLFAAQSESIVITVNVDNLAPSDTSIVISEGDYTNQATVHLGLSANNANYMMVSENPAFAGVPWEGYATEKSWTFVTTAEETKTIYARFKSSAGGISGAVSDSTVLDTTAPLVIIISPLDGDVFTEPDITVEGTVDGVPFSEARTLELGENTVTKEATDEAGNTSSTSITVIYHSPEVIGPEGGDVTSQSGVIVLEVPEGALDTHVAISAIDTDAGDYPDAALPQDGEITGALELFPSGLTFQKPATLNIPMDTPRIPGTPMAIAILNEATNTFEETGAVAVVNSDSYTVTTEITHFSTYAALGGTISSGTPIGGGVDIPTPDLFTGSFTHDIAIEIPKGRKDMHPSLSLQYRSGNPNTWVGFGWQLNPGYIQRSTKYGQPTYNDEEDTFIFVSQSQSTELVHLIDNVYQAKIESGFVKYYKETDDTWYLLTKGGNKMYLGDTVDARQTTAKGTFAWYITRGVDPNGNYIEFEYAKDSGKIYPSRILYTGNEITSATPKYEVVFNLEDRTDISSSYITGEECTVGKRLNSIEVFCNAELVWTYDLEYSYSPDTARSLLTSVTQKGSDGASYPSRTFEYQVR